MSSNKINMFKKNSKNTDSQIRGSQLKKEPSQNNRRVEMSQSSGQQWAIIDYRDARYHGTVCMNANVAIRHGPGIMMLDENYFIISDWNNGRIRQESTIMISPSFGILELKSSKDSNNSSSLIDSINKISLTNPAQLCTILGQKTSAKISNKKVSEWKWAIAKKQTSSNATRSSKIYYMETEQSRNQNQNGYSQNHSGYVSEKIGKIVDFEEVNMTEEIREGLKIEEYDYFIAKVKRILRVPDEKEGGNANSKFTFVVDEKVLGMDTSSIFPSNQDKSRVGSTFATIYSNYPQTFCVSLSSFSPPSSSKAGHNLYKINAIEYFLQSSSALSKAINFSYMVTKIADEQFFRVKQIIKPEVFTYPLFLHPQQGQSGSITSQKQAQTKKYYSHLASAHFVDEYNNALKESIHEIFGILTSAYSLFEAEDCERWAKEVNASLLNNAVVIKSDRGTSSNKAYFYDDQLASPRDVEEELKKILKFSKKKRFLQSTFEQSNRNIYKHVLDSPEKIKISVLDSPKKISKVKTSANLKKTLQMSAPSQSQLLSRSRYKQKVTPSRHEWQYSEIGENGPMQAKIQRYLTELQEIDEMRRQMRSPKEVSIGQGEAKTSRQETKKQLFNSKEEYRKQEQKQSLIALEAFHKDKMNISALTGYYENLQYQIKKQAKKKNMAMTGAKKRRKIWEREYEQAVSRYQQSQSKKSCKI